MRFGLLVEGKTESSALHLFLQRWLNRQLAKSVQITPINLKGSGTFRKSFPHRAKQELHGGRCFAVIGLLDYYGADLPKDVDEARRLLESQVGDHRYRQHFAVYEIEAWLLSDHSIFPEKIRPYLPTRAPEQVNFGKPPSKWLARLYQQKLKRKYKKTLDGTYLFQRLDPDKAYASCPHLKVMLDEMLTLARDAGF